MTVSERFDGPDEIAIFRAIVIAAALDMYATTGMRANRAYTPTAMMAAARKITGRTFKARAYALAADALRSWADAKRAAVLEGV
jgi:hypothetical protein